MKNYILGFIFCSLASVNANAREEDLKIVNEDIEVHYLEDAVSTMDISEIKLNDGTVFKISPSDKGTIFMRTIHRPDTFKIHTLNTIRISSGEGHGGGGG